MSDGERHRRTVQRLFDEVWNGRRYEVIDELYAPDFVADYRPFAPLREGSVHVRRMVEGAYETFPDYHEELIDLVVEGDRAAIHLRISGTQLGAWGPIPPTGKHVEFDEMLFMRFGSDGRVVHQRGVVDNLGAFRQIGIAPSPKEQG